MKGTIRNKEGKWFVEYTYSDQSMHGDLSTNELPLHPINVYNIEKGFTNKFIQEVEFEIVKLRSSDENDKWAENYKVAKLVSPKQEDNLQEFGEIIGNQMVKEANMTNMKTITKEELIDKLLKEIEYVENKFSDVSNYGDTRLDYLSPLYIALSNLIK